MKYRILNTEEWDKLTPLFPDPSKIPGPETSSFAVAEDDSGNITGALALQLQLHMEPLILKSPQVSFERLYHVLYDAVQHEKGLRFFCFSDKEIVDRMAVHLGMIETGYKVFQQEVT